mgnify:CR=1 FL=1
MNALIKLYIANLKEFSRDRVAMFWIIGFPIFFVGLLGMIFGSSGEISYRIGIANLDQGKASTSLVNVFQAVGLSKGLKTRMSISTECAL